MSEDFNKKDYRADALDNGQWHLAVDISLHGIGAWLVPDASLGRTPKTLVRESWQPSEDGLLRRIEDVVYDNPTILDDYSADIIVESERQLWLPASAYPLDEDCAEIHTKVFGGQAYDVLINESGNEKIAFSLIPGLKSFLQRSFPGARIWSQLTLLKEAAMTPHESFKCVVDVRESSADIILLDRSELLCASSHPWKSENDIAYTLLNMLQTYGVDNTDTEIVFSGIREIRRNLGNTLSAYFKSADQKNHDLAGQTIPTAVFLAINRKNNHANNKR